VRAPCAGRLQAAAHPLRTNRLTDAAHPRFVQALQAFNAPALA